MSAMKLHKEKIRQATPETIIEAANCLNRGGIVVCPSDANYGIAVDPFNRQAVEACFHMKQRDGAKPLTLFIADPADWRKYGRARKPVLVEALARLYWPGPLNIIIEKADDAPDLSLASTDTISIACHANPVTRELIRVFGGPVAMTSANISGTFDDGLVDLEAAAEHLGDHVDLLIHGGPPRATRSTTIVRVDDDLTLVREGDLSAERIQKDLASYQEIGAQNAE